ncbi:hypothetical protein DNH61_06530 [Paenibacillus sambharensis]|uniref:Butirosin biosynthesis protein H N-terminal domain-containing protein n=1 Tax=Paenibacillus sambharensis TaxID=1803190 RepID=A0A2W1LDW2_9BACL|nr:hypothetical protein [Paenibacillus sambharensis]PZD96849.1 hypothetical protein DNH61_06530 [Paenibacillus sambharensis]
MDGKSLPIGSPLIKTYLHWAHQATIIAKHDKYLPWVYSNFVQLYTISDEREIKVDYLSYDGPYPRFPGITMNWFERKLFTDAQIDLKHFIVTCIDNDKFVEVSLDEYYIPVKSSFQHTHYVHPTLIYGYNLNKQTYLAVGFDNAMIFREIEIAFSDLANGFYYSEWAGIGFLNTETPIEYTNSSLEFNLPLIKRYVHDFIHSSNSFPNLPRKSSCLGAETYNEIGRKLMDSRLSDDIRSFHIFHEHKQIMLLRLSYMLENSIVSAAGLKEIHQAYRELEQLCLLLRNRRLKHRESGKFDVVTAEKYVKDLEVIRSKEIDALTALYSLL